MGDGTAVSKTGADLLGNRRFESIFLQQRVGNEISCIAAVPRADEFIRVSRSLTSAKYRDPLNLDQHFRTCETSDGNQHTRWKIIAEDLLSQLSKAVTIAGVGDEHSRSQRHRQTGSPGSVGVSDRCASTSSRYREGCGARRSLI